jgi:hypothetical protein
MGREWSLGNDLRMPSDIFLAPSPPAYSPLRLLETVTREVSSEGEHALNSTHATTAISSPADAINALLESHPESFGLSIEQIEEIVQGKCLLFHQMDIDKGNYLDNFLVSFNWWLKIAHVLLSSEVPLEDVNAIWGALANEHLVTDIMSLFSVAHEARYLVEAVGSDPTGLELVKRYWNFRALVCSFVRRCFPGADVQALSKLI